MALHCVVRATAHEAGRARAPVDKLAAGLARRGRARENNSNRQIMR